MLWHHDFTFIIIMFRTVTISKAFQIAPCLLESPLKQQLPSSNCPTIRFAKNNEHETIADTLDLAHQEWNISPTMPSKPYVSPVLLKTIKNNKISQTEFLQFLTERKDPLWEQVKLEAEYVVQKEPYAFGGPQLIYTRILSQPSLVEALIVIASHDMEITPELLPATTIQNLFLETLTIQDIQFIALDVMASTMRFKYLETARTCDDISSNDDSTIVYDDTALFTILFHQGLHAMVCHRLSHRLWLANRTALAYYIQSTVSRVYSVDIHPAASISFGIYLNAGSAGVVIGETAKVEQDVTILQGVTLGGTGKERGDRHPKVGKGVLLQHGATVLGNIPIGEGSIITAKSIVTKPVPSFARVSGVPGKVKSYSTSTNNNTTTTTTTKNNNETVLFTEEHHSLTDLEMQMQTKYLQYWNEDSLVL